MTVRRFHFEALSGLFAICRLAGDAPLPLWLDNRGFSSVTRTDVELSIVTLENSVPREMTAERGWVGFRIAGTMGFEETGILAQVAEILAREEVAIFVVSTFDTDYLFVRDADSGRARLSLQAAGHTFTALQS